MKMKYLKKIIFTLAFVFIASFSFADTGPGDPGSGPAASDPPIGGGAPLAGGIAVLLTLGAAYGGKKVYDLLQENPDEDE